MRGARGVCVRCLPATRGVQPLCREPVADGHLVIGSVHSPLPLLQAAGRGGAAEVCADRRTRQAGRLGGQDNRVPVWASSNVVGS